MVAERASIPPEATKQWLASRIARNGTIHLHSYQTNTGVQWNWRLLSSTHKTDLCGSPRCFRLRLKVGSLRGDGN